jgi:hypothetical protein
MCAIVSKLEIAPEKLSIRVVQSDADDEDGPNSSDWRPNMLVPD